MRLLLGDLRSWRALLWLILLAALSTALAFTPLFDLLGYEFCLALALAGSAAGAHLGSALVAAARRRDEGLVLALRSPAGALFSLIGRSVAVGLTLLALPLLIISLNALRVKNCNYAQGLALFAMMPVLSMTVASTLGALWAVLVPRPALATVLAILTLLGSLSWGVYRFYDAPPIFGYDPFVGYFPGTIYDEDLTIQTPFYFYRLYNVLWLAAATLLAARFFEPATLRLSWHAGRGRRGLTVAAALCLAGAGLVWQLRGTIGFLHDEGSISGALGGVRHTTHFTIYYPADTDEAEIDLLAQDHEFRYAQLSQLLGVTPGRISSYLFRSPEEKRALMGAGHTFIAKPWRREVYLQRGRFPLSSLKHELAHVFAGAFGDRWFGISLAWRMTPLPHPRFNVGLIEGVAVAADWRPAGELTVHQSAAAITRLGLAPPLTSLFGTGFLTEAAGRAYTLAGSFCRYLLERYGAAPLRAVYASGGDFAAAYGRGLPQLLEEWTAFLSRVQVPERELQLTGERHRRPGIFARVCGHEVARLLDEAGELRARGEIEGAARLLEQVSRFDPGEPRHLFELMTTWAAAGREDLALSLERRLLDHPALTEPLQREALVFAGDLKWRTGELGAAASIYARAGGLPAPAAERRQLELRRWALDQTDPVRTLVRDYFLPPRRGHRDGAVEVHLAHRLAELLPRAGIGPYLVGKQLANRGACGEATPELSRSLELGLPGSARIGSDFAIEALTTLGRCQYQMSALSAAAESFARLQQVRALPAGTRLDAEDWAARALWRRTGALPRPADITPTGLALTGH